MARVKVHPTATITLTNNSDDKTPTKETRRKSKVKVEDAEDPDVDVDDQEHVADGSPTPPKPAKRKPRGSVASKPSPGVEDEESPTATPEPIKSAKRKGGNKRKWDHEYCLTCSNYGRACGGRREGFEGCAVCREPNREKGEKLRECLWAEPEKGIIEYRQARDILNAQRQEARAKKGKVPRAKPQAQRYSAPSALSAYQPAGYMTAPDHLGLVDDSRLMGPPSAPPQRSYDLLPPGTTTRAPSATGQSPHGQTFDPRASTMSDNNPRIHPPQVISLDGPQRDTAPASLPIRRPVTRAPPLTPSNPPGGSWAPIHPIYFPFYNEQINSYILPAFPMSNIPPPPQYGTPDPNRYISPYDADAAIPIALSSYGPPRPIIFGNPMHPPTAVPRIRRPPAHPSRVPAQPLDRSGKSPRKWSRDSSKIMSLNGVEWHTTGWKAGAIVERDEDIRPYTDRPGDAVDSASEKSADSSELSSAIDVDETMLEATPSPEKDGTLSSSPVASPKVNGHRSSSPSRSEQDTSRARVESDEAEDRAEALLKSLFGNKSDSRPTKCQRTRSPSRGRLAAAPPPAPAPASAPPRPTSGFVAVNSKPQRSTPTISKNGMNGNAIVDSDAIATKNESEKKKPPIKLRFKNPKAAVDGQSPVQAQRPPPTPAEAPISVAKSATVTVTTSATGTTPPTAHSQPSPHQEPTSPPLTKTISQSSSLSDTIVVAPKDKTPNSTTRKTKSGYRGRGRRLSTSSAGSQYEDAAERVNGTMVNGVHGEDTNGDKDDVEMSDA